MLVCDVRVCKSRHNYLRHYKKRAISVDSRLLADVFSFELPLVLEASVIFLVARSHHRRPRRT